LQCEITVIFSHVSTAKMFSLKCHVIPLQNWFREQMPHIYDRRCFHSMAYNLKWNEPKPCILW